MNCSSLCEILQKLDETELCALIFDGFDKTENESIVYRNLKNILKSYKENLFEIIFNEKDVLIAFYITDWNKNFYKLFLSAIYCGYAYFIIDSLWPKEYCFSLIERVKPDIIISDSVENMSFKEIFPSENKNYKFFLTKYERENRKDLAYIVTTSGTTGIPKLVEVCNSSIIPNIYDVKKILNLESDDLIYQASSLTFDPSLIEIFCAFVSQSKILILPQYVKKTPKVLNKILYKHNITTLQITPTLYKMIDFKIFEQNSFKNLIVGGEKFPNDNTIKNLISNKKNVFNMYGLTELSCWSSYYKVDLNDLEDIDGIPIGSSMSETTFFIKVGNDLVKEPFPGFNGEYELFHSSKKRDCYINGIKNEILLSGDVVMLKNNRTYLKGRNDRRVKINSQMIDLDLIESILRSKWTDMTFTAFILKENYLVVTVFCNLKLVEKDLKLKIRNILSQKLPIYYEPRTIIITSQDNLPISNHGKLDGNKLKILAIQEENNETILFERLDLVSILKKLWQEKLGKEPKNETNFLKAGGNSLKALIFTEEMEAHLQKNSIILKNNLFLDTLLNQTFEKIIELIEKSKFNQKINLNNKKTTKSIIKRVLTHKDSINFSNFQVECCLSKSFAFFKYDRDSEKKNKPISLKSLWEINTNKCVDATPLIILNAFENEDLTLQVYIGSHSGKFLCANALNGELKWNFEATDRIESSSCLDKSGNFILFGSYDNFFYVLNANSGKLHWKFKTGDLIKSSPCIDFENGYAYFGSYDKHIYCVDIKKKSMIWRKNLDSSSIFSGPTCDATKSVYVSTFAGNLFSLDKNNGEVIWNFVLDKASFTSPIIDAQNSLIFLGTCGGTFYCINLDGNLQWNFKSEKPIFTNACLMNEFVLFGSHDTFFYCLSIKFGNLQWKFCCQNEIYSTPFYDHENQLITCINCNGKLFLFDKHGLIMKKTTLFWDENTCYSSPLIFKGKLYVGSRYNFLHCFEIFEN